MKLSLSSCLNSPRMQKANGVTIHFCPLQKFWSRWRAHSATEIKLWQIHSQLLQLVQKFFCKCNWFNNGENVKDHYLWLSVIFFVSWHVSQLHSKKKKDISIKFSAVLVLYKKTFSFSALSVKQAFLTDRRRNSRFLFYNIPLLMEE